MVCIIGKLDLLKLIKRLTDISLRLPTNPLKQRNRFEEKFDILLLESYNSKYSNLLNLLKIYYMEMRMLKKLRNVILVRSLFSKLFISFVLIIIIVSGANYISYRIYKNNMTREIEKTTQERLINVANQYDFCIKEVKDNLLTISRENSFAANPSKVKLKDYEQKIITDQLINLAKFDYIIEIGMILRETDYVLTQNGAYNKERFFSGYYVSQSYSEDFWLKEMEERFTYRIYPTSAYEDKTLFSNGEIKMMMPIAFKSVGKSKVIFISLIDVEALRNSIGPNFMENVYILNENNELLYPSQWNESLKFNTTIGDWKNLSDSKYTVFKHVSDESQLTYIKIFENHFYKSQSRVSEMTFMLIIIISIVLSIFIALVIVNSVNNRAKKIYDIIRKAEKNYDDYDVVDLKNIEMNVGKLISENLDYIQDIDVKSSLLKPYIYQSAIKNIYTNIENIREQIDIKGDYVIACFKIHFKSEFFENQYSTSKTCFLLNELIGLYIGEHFADCITFQVENNSIVALVQLESGEEKQQQSFESILKKLETEKDYLLFTVGISDIRNDLHELNDAYLQTKELIKYRQLSEQSQILVEEKVLGMPGKFNFSVKQSDQFIHSIKNANEKDCLKQIETLIDYNVRLKVSEFHIKMLSSELMNCYIKVITSLYYDIPEELKRRLSYNKFRNAYSSKQYVFILQESAKSVIDYIKSNKEEEDYIIDFVKTYIEEHYNESIYVESLADKINITKTYLSTYFKSKTGTNLSEYIISIRINKAMHLLETTNLKIKEIGVQVGIGNTNTFIRNFKKHTGKSPGEYRKTKEST